SSEYHESRSKTEISEIPPELHLASVLHLVLHSDRHRPLRFSASRCKYHRLLTPKMVRVSSSPRADDRSFLRSLLHPLIRSSSYRSDFAVHWTIKKIGIIIRGH